MLCTEIYKTINKLNPELMNNIFEVKENKRLVREQYRAIETPEWNQVTVRKKNLKVHAPNKNKILHRYIIFYNFFNILKFYIDI